MVMKWLKENHSAVRRELGLVVGKQMRKIPELQFFLMTLWNTQLRLIVYSKNNDICIMILSKEL